MHHLLIISDICMVFCLSCLFLALKVKTRWLSYMNHLYEPISIDIQCSCLPLHAAICHFTDNNLKPPECRFIAPEYSLFIQRCVFRRNALPPKCYDAQHAASTLISISIIEIIIILNASSSVRNADP